MSIKNETPVSITVDHEELDYEEDDVDNSVKKNCPVSLEKQDGFDNIVKKNYFPVTLEKQDDFDNSVKNCPVTLEKQDDVEEGEILDDDSDDYPNKKICEFFKVGRCQLSDQCRYLHVTDKGLYRMLEEPSPTSSSALPPPFIPPLFQLQLNNVVVNTSNLDNCEQHETSPTAWDRALEEAKKLVKTWDEKVNRTSNPIVITLDSDVERHPDKPSKKPRCYKSPKPKVIPRNSSFSDNLGGSPKRNITENKNKGRHEDKWHDPWRRSPVRRAKPPVSLPKISRKTSRASSAISEFNSWWLGRRKQNYLSTSDRRRREDIEKRHKATSRRSSSSSFSPTSVYRPIKHNSETKMQSASEEKKQSPAVENRHGRNLKSNEPIKKDLPSFIPAASENLHKAISRRSSSRSPGATSKYPSCDDKKRTSAKEEKKSPPTVESKFDRNFKNDPSKKDLPSFTPAHAENWHKGIPRRSSSRSPGPTLMYQSRRTSAKEEIRQSRNLKSSEPIKKGLPSFTSAYSKNRHKVIRRRSSSRSPGLTSKYQSSDENRRTSAKEDKKNYPLVENKFRRNFEPNKCIKKRLPSSATAYAENRHKVISPRSSSRSPGQTSVYRSRSHESKRQTKSQSTLQEKNIFPEVVNNPGKYLKTKESVKKDLFSFTPAYTENRHKVIFRRSSSRSPDPTSVYRSRSDESKRQTKSQSALQEKNSFPDVVNNPGRYLKTKESVKKDLFSFTPAYTENRHKAISRRSSSRSTSPASVYRSRSDRSKRERESQSALQEKNIYPGVVNNPGRNLKAKEPVKKDLTLILSACAENRHKAISRRSLSNLCSPTSVHRSRKEKSKNGTKLQSMQQEKSIENKACRNFKTKEPIEKKLPPFSFTSACQSNDIRKWTPRKIRPQSPPVDSCSDMSISPLSDHYLSDLFDPDKKANKLGGIRQRETNRSRTLLPWKRPSAVVYGPICLQASQPVVQSISAAPNCMTEKKAVDLPKPIQVKKKRNTCALEADLLKFQRRPRFADPQPIPEKNEAQRAAEIKANKTPKKDIVSQIRGMAVTKKNEVSKEAPLAQRKQMSRKEQLLKQLEAINAAIQRKEMSEVIEKRNLAVQSQ